MLDGNIEIVIDNAEMPNEDDEANFSAEGWQGGFENGILDVLIDNEFCIFDEERLYTVYSYTAEDGYITEGGLLTRLQTLAMGDAMTFN